MSITLSNISKSLRLNFLLTQIAITPGLLPGTIIQVQIRNIGEAASIQGQGCQLFPKFLDNMDYIIIINLCHAIQSQFYQVLATVGNMAECFPT